MFSSGCVAKELAEFFDAAAKSQEAQNHHFFSVEPDFVILSGAKNLLHIIYHFPNLPRSFAVLRMTGASCV